MNNSELERVQDYIKHMELHNRKDEYKFKRYYLMKYLREGTNLSLSSIGSYFLKDHATVMNGLKRLQVLEGCIDYQLHTNEVSIRFPMDGLLVNSKSFNGNNISNSLRQLERQLLFSKPSLAI